MSLAMVDLPHATTQQIDQILVAIKSLHGLNLKVLRVESHANLPMIEVAPTRRLKKAEVFSRGINRKGRFQKLKIKINDVWVFYQEQL